MNAKGNKMLMTFFLPSSQDSRDPSRHVVASKSERLAHGRRGEPRFTSVGAAIRAAISALRAAPEGDSGTRPEGTLCPDVPAPRRVTGSKASD